MKQTVLQKRIEIIIDYIVILLIIINSKSVFWGIVHAKKSKIVLIIFCFSLLVISQLFSEKVKFSIQSIVSLFIICSLLLFSDFVNNTSLNAIRVFGICLFCVILVVNFIRKDIFLEAYSNLMFIIAVISLICTVIRIISPESALAIAKSYFANNNYYLASPFYTWGWTNLLSRNSGIFWEPGAFQGFLNIAVLTSIEGNIKYKRLKLITLIITILSTMSTTGYIVLAFILFVFFDNLLRIFKIGNLTKGEKIIIELLIVMVMVPLLLSSTVIADKFTADNVSFSIRRNDTIQGLYLCISHFVAGLGNTPALAQEVAQRNIHSSSNGLFAMIYTFGGLFGMYYLYLLKKGINNLFSGFTIIQKWSAFVCFILIFLTEVVYFFPFYMVFVFGKYMRGEVRNDNFSKNCRVIQ